jgi:UDP-glucose 4-epimerase
MRVLVTGAFGYVGRAVTRRLTQAGHEVAALSRMPRSGDELGPAGGGVRVFAGDVRDRNRMRAVFEDADIDAVCHLAALIRVRESFERADEYHAVNAMGTMVLLELAAQAGRRDGQGVVLFVQASTAAVYGAPEVQPIDEDAVPAPASPYGASKLAADEAVRRFAQAGDVAAVCLRTFNVAGCVGGRGDLDETQIIPRTLLAAAGSQPPLEINGDGSAVRDFVHVDDLARAYVLALEGGGGGAGGGGSEFELYNVGATGASVREIVAEAEAVTGRDVPRVHRPARPEVPVLRADTRRVRERLGWKPERSSLREMIADTWSVMNAGTGDS